MSIFHDRLKALKDQCGETQAKIAESLGITPQVFSYYINGREPSYDLLIKIARYFNVTTDYLLGLNNSKTGADDSVLRKTGLTDKAIKNISQFSNSIEQEILNRILEDSDFFDLIEYVGLCFNLTINDLAEADYNNLSGNQKFIVEKMFRIQRDLLDDIPLSYPSFYKRFYHQNIELYDAELLRQIVTANILFVFTTGLIYETAISKIMLRIFFGAHLSLVSTGSSFLHEKDLEKKQ